MNLDAKIKQISSHVDEKGIERTTLQFDDQCRGEGMSIDIIAQNGTPLFRLNIFQFSDSGSHACIDVIKAKLDDKFRAIQCDNGTVSNIDVTGRLVSVILQRESPKIE